MLERTFDICQDTISDLSFERVRRWKGQHPAAKVIGYFPFTFDRVRTEVETFVESLVFD